MSAEIMKTGMSSELEKFKQSIQNKEPELVGTGTVSDIGLFYVKPGEQSGTVWKSNVEDLDGFQLKLNKEKITNINRAYRFNIEAGGRLTFKTMQMNTMSMRAIGWPTLPLKMGDRVELYAWRNRDFVQYAYKKA
jgi:hypothetical protein